MRLTVLQWNVWFKEDIARVLDFLLKHKADIICLQELTRGYVDQTQENTWDYIAHELGYDYHFKDMPIINGAEEWFQGNATFSRFPIEHRHSAWLSEPAGDGHHDDQYRVYLQTEILVGDKKLSVGNTHLSYKHLFSNDGNKSSEVEKLLEQIGTDKTHYVLCGDLNVQPASSVIKQLLTRLKNAGPDFDQKTWTTKPFVFKDFKADTLDWRFDYIFVSHDIEIIDSKIIETEISDHLPVWANIKLSG